MIIGLWVILYFYLIYQVGRITKGLGKFVMAALLMIGVEVFLVWLKIPIAGALAVIVIMGLYVLFFDDEPFRCQYALVLIGGLPLLLRSFLNGQLVLYDQLLILISCGVFFTLIWWKRQQRNWLSLLGVLAGDVCFVSILLLLEFQPMQKIIQPLYGILTWGVVSIGLIFFFVQERTLWKYQKGFLFQTNHFQEQLLVQQYEEIQAVYLNMRGFKHDYHNTRSKVS